MKTTTNAVLLAIAACFVTVVAACTVVYVVDSETSAGFITPILGFTGTTLALVAGLATVARKQTETKEQLDDVKQTTDYLANGGLDAKIRAGLADLLPDHLMKPGVEDQLEQDRATREAGPGGTTS
jgi:hypothetical protein